MYSWEIENLLRLRNYLVTAEEYFKISNSNDNPQVWHVKYDGYNDDFLMETDDNYTFKFKVKKLDL